MPVSGLLVAAFDWLEIVARIQNVGTIPHSSWYLKLTRCQVYVCTSKYNVSCSVPSFKYSI